MRLAACQPYVRSYFNFLLADEPRLQGWQSGAFWADLTPKDSHPGFLEAISAASDGTVDCDALKGGRPSADFMPPSAPTGLAATALDGPLRVELAWSVSSDDLSAIGYRVYRDGAHVGTTSTASWTNVAVAPATTYTYTVRALDSAGNLGDASASATVTTTVSGPPPPPPAPPPPAPPPLPDTRTIAPPSTRSVLTTRTGTAGRDVLRGTPGRDVLRGLGGPDRLYGLGGNDVLVAGRGRDRLFGGSGSDVMRAVDGMRDTIACGGGRDLVYADRIDKLTRDCERIRRSGRRT